MSRKTRTEQPDEMTFEDGMAQLDEIVRKLESGALSLDESLALFERGQRLATWCNARLDQAELKVRQLTAGPDDTDPLAALTGDEGGE